MNLVYVLSSLRKFVTCMEYTTSPVVTLTTCKPNKSTNSPKTAPQPNRSRMSKFKRPWKIRTQKPIEPPGIRRCSQDTVWVSSKSLLFHKWIFSLVLSTKKLVFITMPSLNVCPSMDLKVLSTTILLKGSSSLFTWQMFLSFEYNNIDPVKLYHKTSQQQITKNCN